MVAKSGLLPQPSTSPLLKQNSRDISSHGLKSYQPRKRAAVALSWGDKRKLSIIHPQAHKKMSCKIKTFRIGLGAQNQGFTLCRSILCAFCIRRKEPRVVAGQWELPPGFGMKGLLKWTLQAVRLEPSC